MKDSPYWVLISGVIVFAVSQYFLKLVLEPIASLRRVLSSISSTILFHQAKITNARPDDKVSEEIKQLASSLLATVAGIFCYGVLSHMKIFGLPPREAVRKACREMNGLSHGMNQLFQQADEKKDWAGENTKAIHRIGELLGIPTHY